MNRPLHRRLTTFATAVVAVLAVVFTAGCGFDAQTLQPYTPADGVSFTLGDPPGPTLKVRNLFILADDQGAGFLTASMIVDGGEDTLRSVSGVALKVDGTTGGELSIGSFSPIAIGSSNLVVLINLAPITISGTDLEPGVGARLVLTFATAGPRSIDVPVIDSSDPVYAGVTPSPAATPSG